MLRVRPTSGISVGSSGPRRVAVAAVAVVVVTMVVAVSAAWFSDRNDYPGQRSGIDGAAAGRVLPPTNAVVDDFETDGPLRVVGPWKWSTEQGAPWRATDGVVRGPTAGGTVLVQPVGERVIVAVDIYRPVDGAALLFRWRDDANHWALEVANAGAALTLVRVANGVRSELGDIPETVQGSNLRVTLLGNNIDVAVNGVPRLSRRDSVLAGERGVGLHADDDVTRFDQFAVLAD